MVVNGSGERGAYTCEHISHPIIIPASNDPGRNDCSEFHPPSKTILTRQDKKKNRSQEIIGLFLSDRISKKEKAKKKERKKQKTCSLSLSPYTFHKRPRSPLSYAFHLSN
jgi:hypothetical protein